jgi:hypothetical protein
MLNNATILVESRCFAYDNNENNVKQCKVSIQARVRDREKRKKQNPENRLKPEHVSITR